MKTRREKLGLTQAQLAGLFGCSIRQIKMLESGERSDGKPLRARGVYELALDGIEARVQRGALGHSGDLPKE